MTYILSIYAPPSISSDGTLYLAHINELVALNQNGIEKWSLDLSSIGMYTNRPVILGQDIAYLQSGSNLLAIKGTLKISGKKFSALQQALLSAGVAGLVLMMIILFTLMVYIYWNKRKEYEQLRDS